MAKSSWCAKGCVSLDLYKFWKRARIFSPNHEQTCHRCAQKNVTTDGKHTIYVHGFFILYIKDNHIQHGLLKWCLLMRQICPQARSMDGPFSSVFLFFGWHSHTANSPSVPTPPHHSPFPSPSCHHSFLHRLSTLATTTPWRWIYGTEGWGQPRIFTCSLLPCVYSCPHLLTTEREERLPGEMSPMNPTALWLHWSWEYKMDVIMDAVHIF